MKVAKKFSELTEAMPDITDLLEDMVNDPRLRNKKVLLDYYTYKSDKKE